MGAITVNASCTPSAANPFERIRQVNALIEEHQAAIADLGRVRRDALDELISAGTSQADIAKQLSMSRARVSQLLANSNRRPERALLSAGDSVTVAVPVEGAPHGDGSRRMLVEDDMEFVARLKRTAEFVGLKFAEEHVGPNEFIDLNRAGLIVTCGPRQSPWLEQSLTADERYGFDRDAMGWYLEDKSENVKYRSPEDSGEARDHAYLGSLPRPDGKGFWLYAAGIHAAGSRGAAEYLETHIESLYSETKGSLWSCLVTCTFDRATRAITSAELLTPVVLRGSLRSRKK